MKCIQDLHAAQNDDIDVSINIIYLLRVHLKQIIQIHKLVNIDRIYLNFT